MKLWNAIKKAFHLQKNKLMTNIQIMHAFNVAASGMGLLSPDGNWIKVNKALCEMLGYTESELLKKSFLDITSPEDIEITKKCYQQFVNKKINNLHLEKRYVHKKGHLIWAIANISILRDRSDKVVFFIAQIQDISQQKKVEEMLVFNANSDPLTGLANRNHLKTSVEQLISASPYNQKSCAIFFLDIDYFKQINDSLGHETGDILLKIIAERLRFSVDASSFIGRLGGDEFIIAVPNLENFDLAAGIAKKILENIIKPVTIQKNQFTVSASIGISIFPVDGMTYDALIKNADSALYRAKQLGRNNFQFFKQESNIQS